MLPSRDSSHISATDKNALFPTPTDCLLIKDLALSATTDSDFETTSIEASPIRFERYGAVSFGSLIPRVIRHPQLFRIVIQLSRYRFFNCGISCMIMTQLICLERTVAIFLSQSGITPRAGNSSRRKSTGMGSFPSAV